MSDLPGVSRHSLEKSASDIRPASHVHVSNIQNNLDRDEVSLEAKLR
jgi:hypothetical protein